MNKTFIFQKVFGSYEVVMWIVVADSMEEAFQAMRTYFENLYKDYREGDDFYVQHGIEHQTPIPAHSLIKGVNYDPLNDVCEINSNWISYHSASGTYKKTKTEGWWDWKEFNSDLPKGYIVFEAHDG